MRSTSPSSPGALRRAAAVLAFGAVLAAAETHAIEVTAEGETYDVSFITTSYDDNPGLFVQEFMPWFGNSDLALGLAINYYNNTSNLNKLFAYQVNNFATTSINTWTANNIDQTDELINSDEVRSYAYLAPAEIPEIDGPVFVQLLAVLGAGWLAVASRRREQDAAAA